MFRLRSKSGDESVFRTPEEIRSALLSGFVTPDAQIWDPELKGWVPLLEHALYQQIASTPGGRKSGAMKAPLTGSTPAAPKPPAKLVIKRPGDAGTTAVPAVKPPAPPAAPPKPPARTTPPVTTKPVDDLPDLELIDLDLTPEPELTPAPPTTRPAPRTSAPRPPVVETPAPPKRPTPPPAAPSIPAPAREPAVAARTSSPRVSNFRMAAAEEAESRGGAKKWIVMGAVVILAAGGGAFAMMRGRAEASPPADSTLLAGPVAQVIDPVLQDSSATSDTASRDSAAAPAAADTAAPVAAAPVATVAPSIILPPAPGVTGAPIEPVAFAPAVARGPAPWTARPMVGLPLTMAALEVVRLRYSAAQSRALEQFEAGLASAGFADLFDPSRVSTVRRREESLESVDAGRSALREFRRRQAAIDFAYTDSIRQAVPAGSDRPDFRTFGPLLRESPAQAALTDSIVGGLAEIYGMLVGEPGGYTFRGGMLTWKEADNAGRYRALQERLTSQIARVRTLSVLEVPPAMAAVLRGIGLPR